MARQILAWQCRFCGTVKKTENVCLRHEKACNANPNRKNCIDCIHSRKEYGETQLSCSKRHILCTRAVSAGCTDYDPKEEN